MGLGKLPNFTDFQIKPFASQYITPTFTKEFLKLDFAEPTGDMKILSEFDCNEI